MATGPTLSPQIIGQTERALGRPGRSRGGHTGGDQAVGSAGSVADIGDGAVDPGWAAG